MTGAYFINLINSKMETKYIKMDHLESLAAKKQLLLAQLNILYLLKRFSNYKAIRKREFILKNKLKSSITAMRSKLNLINSSLPREEISAVKTKTTKKIQKIKKSSDRKFEDELSSIKEKLEKLG